MGDLLLNIKEEELRELYKEFVNIALKNMCLADILKDKVFVNYLVNVHMCSKNKLNSVKIKVD